uniref:Myb X n=1 Tax=Solanum tuberosum TaxID=4113 RepID=M1DEG6_SOLTU
MDEIYNYEDSSAQATDEVESSEENSDNGDEETNRDSQDTGDEDDDPLSLPTCAREISGKSYNLTTWMDELESFPAKIYVVHPYIIPTVCETKQNYMETLKPYTDEVKNTIIDDLKASLKGVTVLTSAEGNVEDEYSNDHNPNQPCENYVPSTSKDESLGERVASPEQSMVEIVAFMKEEEMKEEEKQQDEEKMTGKEEEKMEENDEEKEEEKLEEKKEEESEEENLEEKKN